VRILPGLALGLWTWWRRLVRGGRHGLTLPAARRRVRPSHHWARNGPVKIAYELRGRDGPAVVLVHGVAMGRWGWAPVAERLARDFRVVTIDNRGVGDSDAPVPPYSAAEMAADVLAVLDAEGIDRCHLVGASLGGMVAQQLALTWPDRVERLVLACTVPGGLRNWAMPPETMYLLLWGPLLPERVRLQAFAEHSLGARTLRRRPELARRLIALRQADPQPSRGWLGQMAAGTFFDPAGRQRHLRQPTLVLHGTDDQVVDPRNAEELAALIPAARLVWFQGARHLFFWERPARFVRLVSDFLQAPAWLLQRSLNGRSSRRPWSRRRR
jgi:3-oxoadipate enol-lactonase